MRHLIHTISLEGLTSRLPSIWPAYHGDEILFFGQSDIQDREGTYPSNYGLVPVHVALSGATCTDGVISVDQGKLALGCPTDQWACKCDENLILSFARVSKMYHFFMAYHELLTNSRNCRQEPYVTAVEYYNVESTTRKSSTFPYGNDPDTYAEMDRQFNAYGGQEMFDFIKQYVVPMYDIPSEYADAWNTNHLFYPDVLKWMAWFKDKNVLYSSKTCTDSSVTDCCECEKYKALGGKEIFDSMGMWYIGVRNALSQIKNRIGNSLDYDGCFSTSFGIRINLQNGLENPGFFSILSEEYQLGVDYRVEASADRYSGKTVVDRDGESLVLIPGDSHHGYVYDETYKELKYDEASWSSYTETYMNDKDTRDYKGTQKEFVVDSGSTYYAFLPDGRRVLGSTSGEVLERSYDMYGTTNVSWVINGDGDIFDIMGGELGRYKGEEYEVSDTVKIPHLVEVFREKGTDTPYVIIGNRKKYATVVYTGDTMCYKFPFIYDDKEHGPKRVPASGACGSETFLDLEGCTAYPMKLPTELREYIISGGTVLELTQDGIDGTFRIDEYGNSVDDTYYHVRGEGSAARHFKYVNSEEEGEPSYEDFIVDENVTFEGDNKLKVKYTPDVHTIDLLSGHTSSKLRPLRVAKVLTDDIGKDIEGIFPVAAGNSQERPHHPYQGQTLEPIYQVGNVANMMKFSMDGNDNLYVGDVITKMSFYHKDASGNKITKKPTGEDIANAVIDAEKFMYNNSGVTSGGCLSAISGVTDAVNRAGYSSVTSASVWCDVTYLVGATLDASGNTVANTNSGVEYTESVQFVKENAHYGLRRKVLGQIPTTMNEVSATTISYPICIYKMVQEMHDMESATYGNTYQDALAQFKVNIPYYTLGTGNVTVEKNMTKDMETRNGMEVYPVFMEEHCIGASAPKNVSSNIYIDRGINTALDKHLKFGEVTSLEALQNYGNRGFNIVDAD